MGDAHAAESQVEAQVEIARSLSSTLELEPLLKALAQQAARACEMDRCSVFLYRGERLVPVMSQFADGRVDPDLGKMFKAREAEGFVRVPFLDEAVATRAPIVVDDAQTDPRIPVSLRNFRGRRILALPLMRPDKVVGVLTLAYVDRDRPIRPAQINLGMTIGSQIALALENWRLLAETRSQAAALREKNVELDSFIYTVSHDLKAPLMTIQGMSSLVLEEHAAGLDEEGRHYLERIQANTEHMERLILDLLALSRIGREGRSAEKVHLGELVDEVLVDLTELLRERGIKVVMEDLATVWAVRGQMEQVLRNLVTNAIKYMGDAPSPTIEIGTLDRGAELECWVRDTGIGIDAAYHERVFEVFQRLKEVEAEGSGVGLTIAKKIVQAGGGRIWVESARGQGSTFRFTWPAGPGR
jgi:signal transduction histidine kinase